MLTRHDRLEQAAGTTGLVALCSGMLIVGGGMALASGAKSMIKRGVNQIRVRNR